MLQAIAEAMAPRRVRSRWLSDPRAVGVRNSKSLDAGTRRRQRGGGQTDAERKRDRGARRGISARAETARPADAVGDGAAGTKVQPRAARARISASCFRTLSGSGHLSFFAASPDSIISAPEFTLDPAIRRNRQAGQSRIAFARATSQPHLPLPARADRPFRGIALILASTIFLGTSDVTAKYLSATLPSIEIAWLRFPGVRADHGAGDAAGFAALCAADRPPRFAGDARRRAAGVVAVLHLRLAVSPDRGSLRHRFRLAAVRHRAVDLLSRRERRPAPLARDRGRPGRRAGHPAAGLERVSSRRVFPDRLGAGLGLHPDHDADDERHANAPSPP